MEKTLLEFGQRAYQNFDESHNFDHAMQVWLNCKAILDALAVNFKFETIRTIMYTAILHDAIDYKYENKWVVTPDELLEFLVRNLGAENAGYAFFTINNGSWSKREKVDPNDKNFKFEIFHIVRDADWIESIRVERCINYSIMVRREIPGGVIKHIEEKLMHVIDHLNFETSRNLARSYHNDLMKWYHKYKI
jgi:HD superfamily phosphodiesterase